jgi:hypothetical protein
MRLIDADELLNIADETALAWEYRRIVSDIRNIVEKAPTINPADLRPRGRWETSLVKADGVETYSHFHNDEKCKYFYADHDCAGSPYCPNCGARMEDGDG